MKYCVKCGSQLEDEAVICPHCGCVADPMKFYNHVQNQKPKEKSYTLRKIALIFNWVTVGLLAFIGVIYLFIFITAMLADGVTSDLLGAFIFSIVIMFAPIAWMLPMTINLQKCYKNKSDISTAFKVCNLIFVNQIAGILLLCEEN